MGCIAMKKYTDMTKAELEAEFASVQQKYNELKAQGLSLNMARGKPGKKQLDMVSSINDILKSDADFSSGGVEARNYGNVDGLPAAKEYFAELLGTKAENVFVGGNASLQLMYDVICKAFTHGLLRSEKPWAKEDKIKWICPAPGYDRHFKITETFGVEMIPVPLKEDGPDMDLVEQLAMDSSVKGMWCVPKYSNPDGVVYSDEVIERIASLKHAAPDFTLMWDNAYCVHEFKGDFLPFQDILSECEKHGNADMVFEFASTSKITLPGAGISCFACSKANMEYMKKLINIQTIGFDKVNQLRHVMFLKNREETLALMKRHAEILGPKFEMVTSTLEKEIAPLGIAKWRNPNGGYFISLYAMPGTAARTWQLCRDAGLVMTGAGATWPLGKDPDDSNLRIAPSLPEVEELSRAMEILCVCLKFSSLEKLLAI